MMSVSSSPPSGARLFISYRRDDSAGYARALNDRLAAAFGAERVFIDVDDIPAGAAFDATIAQALGGAAVLLVLIGPRWLAPQPGGMPRLHDAADFVHREIAAGLAGGAQVIPLLLDGAAMPGAAQLPAPLQALSTRQALVVDARRFGADTEALLAQLRPVMGDAPSDPPDGPGRTPGAARAAPARRGWLLGAAALLAGGGLAWWATRRDGPAAPLSAAPAAPAAAPTRAAVNGRWEAEVAYAWLPAPLRETLVLQGEAGQLAGTASFLRVPRGIEEGVLDGARLRFVTRSTELLGATERTVTHRYSGTLDGDVLRLTLQTEGAAQPHPPLPVTARRVAPP
jgi:hypothetical protein